MTKPDGLTNVYVNMPYRHTFRTAYLQLADLSDLSRPFLLPSGSAGTPKWSSSPMAHIHGLLVLSTHLQDRHSIWCAYCIYPQYG